MATKLTPDLLRTMILGEQEQMNETLETGNSDTDKTKADETDASDFADTIIKKVNWMKQLQIKESQLKKELVKTRAQKQALRKTIMEAVGE